MKKCKGAYIVFPVDTFIHSFKHFMFGNHPPKNRRKQMIIKFLCFYKFCHFFFKNNTQLKNYFTCSFFVSFINYSFLLCFVSILYLLCFVSILYLLCFISILYLLCFVSILYLLCFVSILYLLCFVSILYLLCFISILYLLSIILIGKQRMPIKCY